MGQQQDISEELYAREQHRRGRLRRYQQIVRVLGRHGFGWLLGQLGLEHLVPFRWGPLARRRPAPYTQAQRLRLALEELGTTFIKLGQILSTRSDLLPPDYILELSRLQDALPPEPERVIEAQIARELGRAPSDLFAEFQPRPLGSASIGQVHAASLRSGEEVVVKVQRPGIEAVVEEDLAILTDLARLAANRTLWGRIYDLPGLVEEFAATLRSEMDYLQEGRNANRFRSSFAGDARIHVPTVHWDYTTRRVITLERFRGVKINDLAALEEAGVDRHKLARAGTQIVLEMVLEDGFFHADPHPGNFLVTPEGAIALLDYGMVGQVDDSTREGLLYLLLAVTNQDLDRVVDQLVALGVVGTTIQLERLRRDLGRLLSVYWNLSLKEIDVARILEEVMETVRHHRLQVPTKLVLLAKTLAMNEGLARTLDPQFSTAEVLQPYAPRLLKEILLPRRWSKRLFPTLLDLGRLAVTLPRRSERLLTQLERGNLSINFRLQEVDQILDALSSMVNRLILGMLVSGFVVGLALLLQIYYSAGLGWLIGWTVGVGLVVVVFLGFWLALHILRRVR